MSKENKKQVSRVAWLTQPQMLVGLSALLLSICGLFISIYEASLIRQSQRASVWPHVQVALSTSDEAFSFWVQNTGIGPARIHLAAVTYQGGSCTGWPDLFRKVAGDSVRITGAYYSRINDRVLPPDSRREIMFSLKRENPSNRHAIRELRRALNDREVDIVVCYSSVYDEHWKASLQDSGERSGEPGAGRSQPVDDCGAIRASRI